MSEWQQIRNSYLRQIEDELILVRHPRKKEVLEDVAEHLDRRFEELPEQDRTEKRFRVIIEEMGPPEEYAELLADNALKPQVTRPALSDRLALLNLLLTLLFIICFIGVIVYRFSQDNLMDNAAAVTSRRPAPDFQSDPELIGRWISVDFVSEPEDFRPAMRNFRGDLYLKEMTFYDNGSTDGPWTWTKGTIYHRADKTKAHYIIQTIDGKKYLFFEWMSGDVTIRGMKPHYYVLMREGQAETVTVDRKEMKMPMLPGMDSALVGHWITVDFVKGKDEFRPEQPTRQNSFYLKELTVYPDGTTSLSLIWKNNKLYDPVDQTEGGYEVRDYDQGTFLLMEWISGDVTIRGMKPCYYVLKREP